MKLKDLYMQKYFILFTILIITSFFQASAQPVQFKILIKIRCASKLDTLWLGVSGDGPGGIIRDNTYGVDYDTTYGPLGQWREDFYPPDFPGIEFLSKFVDLPGRSEFEETGIRPYDFRGFTSMNQIDSFAIRIYGDNVVKGKLTLSWPSDLKKFGKTWKLLKMEGSKYRVVVRNMISTMSYTDPNVGHAYQLNYLLIKSGVVTSIRHHSAPGGVK